jgi:hypothetical protein
MGNKKPKTKKVKYVLGGIEFYTWEEVVKHSREILKKGRRELEGEEFAFVRDLVEYHLYADEKLKRGVSKLSVRKPEYGSNHSSWLCYWITDSDGFEADFSHKKCKPGNKKDVGRARRQDEKESRLNAYRDAVREQTDEWRRLQPKQLCSCCESPFDIQVDHIEAFVSIVSKFEYQYSFDEYPQLERHNDSAYTIRFSTKRKEDALFVESWQRYHRANSSYQLLCGQCNLAKSSSRARYVTRNEAYDGDSLKFSR